MQKTAIVTVTGAAGQISYALLFRIAAGAMLGTKQPLSLKLLEIPAAMPALEGVLMELQDAAFPLLRQVIITDEPEQAFADADYALLVGSRPRNAAMERNELLAANAEIFSRQGRVLNAVASRDVRVLVVGNPANTNALIAAANAPDLDARQFTAMTRLDHNRALNLLAAKTGSHSADIRRMTVWGNHSSTQYPDIFHATVNGKAAVELVSQDWVEAEFIPTVQQRGSAVIKARGASSAASAAAAAIAHMRDWSGGTASDDWVSMAVASDGSYGIQPGVMYSFPVTCNAGDYRIVPNLEISDFSRAKMLATEAELQQEKAAVAHLL